MRRARSVKTICAALIAISAACYAGHLAYDDWGSQAPFRAARARERETERQWQRIEDAVARLERHGARYPDCKGLGRCFRCLDLSQWKGTASELDDLRVLADLPQVYPEASTLFIRLGPNIDSSIVPILQDIKNLRVLELNGARLSADEVENLLAKLPACRIGDIGFEEDCTTAQDEEVS